MRTPRARTLVRMLFAALLGPAAASAQSVAVLGVEADNVPEATASALTEALRQRAAATPGIQVVQTKEFMELKLLYGCMDHATIATCLAPAGKTLGADRMVIGLLTGKRKKVSVSLKLVDARAGTVVKFVEEEVPATSDIVGSAGRWFAALVPAPAVAPAPPPPKPGSLIVGSDPADASVTVDGTASGHTPVAIPATPGTHTVVIAKDGFEPDTRSVTVRAGEDLRVDATLKAVAAPAPPSQPPPVVPPPAEPAAHPGRTLKIVGVIAAVAGLAAIGVEIYTWQSYLGLQNSAFQKLGDLQRTNPDYAAARADWFQKPTCTPPPGVSDSMPRTTSSTYQGYVNDCNNGNTLAAASTALLLTGIVLGAAGITAFAIGTVQSRGAEKPAAALAPRLRLVSPVVTKEGGGVSAAFEF